MRLQVIDFEKTKWFNCQSIPDSGIKTPDGILYPSLPLHMQFCMVCFVMTGSPFAGKMVGDLIEGLSESGYLFLYFPYLFVTLSGYGLWVIRLSLKFRNCSYGGGELSHSASFCADRLQLELGMRIRVAVQKDGSCFSLLGWITGGVAGGFSTLFYSIEGPRFQLILVFSTLVIWGYFLSFLGRRGYLPPVYFNLSGKGRPFPPL